MIADTDRFDGGRRHMKRLSHLLGLVDVVSELLPDAGYSRKVSRSFSNRMRRIFGRFFADGFFAAKLNEIITRGGQSSRIKKEVQ